MRVAWFGALDHHSVSGYFTRAVLPFLETSITIDLFHDSERSFCGRPVYHFLTAWERDQETPYDLFFYQVEDSPAAGFVRMHLALEPGAILFHNFTMSNFGPEPILNSPWQTIVARFGGTGVPWPERRKEHEQIGPLAAREAAFAALALFSTERDHVEFCRQRRLSIVGGKCPSYHLPLPAAAGTRERRPEGGFCVAVCGSPRIEYRAHAVMAALVDAPAGWNVTWMVPEGFGAEARQLADDFGVTRLEIIDGLTPDRWAEQVSRADAAIHLLFSVFGHVGPYLQLSAACGCPCLVSNFGAGELMPANLFFRINPGMHEQREVRAVLEKLSEQSNDGLSAEISAFAREQFDPRGIAQDLARVWWLHRGFLGKTRERWSEFRSSATTELIAEVQRLRADPVIGDYSALQRVEVELGWRER